MRIVSVTLVVLLISLGVAPVASAQTADERGASSAGAARDIFGSEQGLVQHGIEPLSDLAPMRTVDGQSFQANLSCAASERFLRVTMFPAGSDIGRFVVELDTDLDGRAERALNFTGPFAGVCSNGVIRCAAGSWENCQFLRWETAGGVLALAAASQQELGACYCFNASCGNNLLVVNSDKVVGDLGTSVLNAARSLLPRVTSTRTVVTPLSVVFLGQRNSCGTDDSPEQFYTRPNELAAAGVAARAIPGTVANFVSGTAVARGRGVATMRCEINRHVGAEEISKSDILNFISATRGDVQDCGPGCLRFLLGQDGNNYYGHNERCRIFEEALQLEVLRPDLIDAFRLVRATYDDHIVLVRNDTVLFQRVHDIIWPDPVNGAPLLFDRFGRFSCERGDEWDVALNVDLRGALPSVGTHQLRLRTAVGGEGDAALYFEARVREACEVGSDEIVDGCAAAQANAGCRLRNEWVDGVQTVREFMTTGLGPLPSARTVGSACTVSTGARPWWRTEREYDCPAQHDLPDLSAAAERYESIHRSIDLGNGAYTDLRRNADGTHTALPTSIPVLAERGSNACTPTCRTRRPRPGANVSGDGPTTALNVTGVAYDFSFLDCNAGNHCPVEAGEEIVAACDCHNNFAQAVAMMQTIRMVAEDASCEVPE